MIKKLFPKEYKQSIYNIDYKALKERGVKALFFDLDNTVAPYDVARPDSAAGELLRGLVGQGFAVCLLSNNGKERVSRFNEGIGVGVVWSAKKPLLFGMKKALALTGAAASEAVMVGDQIFTDVWGANRAGIYSILVKPVSNREEFFVKLKRGFETMVINAYLRSSKEQE